MMLNSNKKQDQKIGRVGGRVNGVKASSLFCFALWKTGLSIKSHFTGTLLTVPDQIRGTKESMFANKAQRRPGAHKQKAQKKAQGERN